jgi:UDP:flavonoid glycosyltransferase YjiC (YdhE family)
VPMVVVPLFADQPHNAGRVQDIGAGVALDPDGLVRLGDVVRGVLADRSYRAAARRVADEVKQYPTVDSATRILRNLVYSQPRSVA